MVLDAPVVETQPVLRFISYAINPGSEGPFMDVMSQIEAQCASIPGLLNFCAGFTGSDYTGMMIFASADDLANYRAGIREEFLAQLAPFLAGPPTFDYEVPLLTHIIQQGPADGHVLRIVGYQCQPGMEEAWGLMYDELIGEVANGAIPGLVFAVAGFIDTQTFLIGTVMESQAHLDNYMVSVREQFLERMKPMMAGGPIIQAVAPVRVEFGI